MPSWKLLRREWPCRRKRMLQDSGLAGEAPWRESKIAQPSDNMLRKACAQHARSRSPRTMALAARGNLSSVSVPFWVLLLAVGIFHRRAAAGRNSA